MSHQSRLARAAEREKLGQSQQAQQGGAQLGLDALVPMMISQGLKPGIEVGGSSEPPMR